METLTCINETLGNIICATKTKKSTDRTNCVKKFIESLNSQLTTFGKENHNQFVRSLAMEGYLTLLSTKTIQMSLLEKRDSLKSIYDKLKPFALRAECLYVALRIQNLLCYYLIQLKEINAAKVILDETEDLYDKIDENDADKYYDVEDLFSAKPLHAIKKVDPDKIDKIITNNMQMQAFLCNELRQPHMYTLYQHTVLRRQLELKEGSPQVWALRCAHLGNYFTSIRRLGNARHHLCSAYHVLKTCQENSKLFPEESILQMDCLENFDKHFLELSHHWVKYGLTLFEMSKKKILKKYFSRATTSRVDLWTTVNKNDDDSESITKEKSGEIAKVIHRENGDEDDFDEEKLLIFPSLDLRDMETRVPLKCATTSEEARRIFTFTHKWLMRARNNYSIENNSTQYVACSLQLAQLYEHLAFFERTVDSQYDIQKRRADVLEHLSCVLKNREYAAPIQIDVLKELSQVQLDMMALNLRKLWQADSKDCLADLENKSETLIQSITVEAPSKATIDTSHASSIGNLITQRKVEATASLNERLFRLCNQLTVRIPPQYDDLASIYLKNKILI